MNGVTVLSQRIPLGGYLLKYAVGILIFAIIITLFLYAIRGGIRAYRKKDYAMVGIYAVCMGLVCMWVTTSELRTKVSNLAYTEYTVTIGEEVKVKEFSKYFEIKKQQGDLYIIRQKTDYTVASMD